MANVAVTKALSNRYNDDDDNDNDNIYKCLVTEIDYLKPPAQIYRLNEILKKHSYTKDG